MSINAKPWEGAGGAATVPDASETVKGKIRIATTAESTAGLDDLTAMTPAKVKARIDAALVGGVEYKGEYTGQSLVTALKGDMYISSGSQTLGGVSLSNGDHIIFNEDAANPVTSSMFDVIDNTETPASETVAGVIEIATNAEAAAGTATDKALVPSNISSIDLSQADNTTSGFISDITSESLNDLSDVSYTAGAGIDNYVLTYDHSTTSWGAEASATGGNQITLIDIKTTSFTAVSNAVYEIQSSLTVTMPGSPSEGDLIGFYAQGTATPSLTVSGTIETINNVQTTSTTIEVNKRNVVWWGYDGARWQQLNDSIKVATASLAGVLETASNTETAAATATDRALTPSNIGSIDLSDADNTTSGFISGITGESLNDLSDVAYTAGAGIDNYVLTYDHSTTSWGAEAVPSAASASETVAGVIEIATNAEAAAGTATDKALVPSNISSVDLSQADNTTSGFISGITGESLNDLSDVSFTAGAGIDNYVLTYDNSTTSWGAEAVPSASAASETVAGVIEIATNAEAAAGTATDKALVPSNISSVDLSQADNTTSGFISGITGESLNDLSDVSYTAGAGIDNYVLTYDHSTTSWGAEAAASGGLSAVVDDTTPQLGGALDVNGNAITSASNGDVTINPDGTGDISVGADIIPDADATHTLGSEDNRFITLHSELNGAVQFKARNETGGPLTKGQAVYISGVSGDVPLVSLARANSASTMPAHGLLAADVSNNADVQVISFGNLTAYDTTTHSLSLGDTVYVSAATAGALTSSAPAGETNLIQNIGKVVRASATEGIIKVGGAGRSAATPNLDNGKIFLGNGSNQAVSTALSSAAVTSFNTQTGALTIGGDDLTADHTAVNYTAANANIDGHFSGIDSALALKAPLASPSLTGTPTAPTATQGDNSTQLATTAYVDTAVSGGGGGVDPTLTILSNTTYTLSAANAPGIHIWYGASNSSTFTVTMPDIANVLSTAVSVNGDPGPTFEVYIGRGQAGDITVSAADGIDLLGDGSITYSTTQTVDSGQWVKLVGWYASGSTQRYLMDSAAQPRDAGLTSISGLTTAADQMIYTTASDTYAVTDLTSAGRALLDDADAAAQRTTLGLGTAATSASSDFLASTAGLNDLSDVSYTAGAGIDNYVLTYDHATTSWGAEAAASGGGGWTYSAITADPANAQAGYHYSCTGSFTITLPTTGVSAGEEVRIKNMGTGTITVDPQTSNIDGSTADYVMDIQYGAITLVSTGTHWEII